MQRRPRVCVSFTQLCRGAQKLWNYVLSTYQCRNFPVLLMHCKHNLTCRPPSPPLDCTLSLPSSCSRDLNLTCRPASPHSACMLSLPSFFSIISCRLLRQPLQKFRHLRSMARSF